MEMFIIGSLWFWLLFVVVPIVLVSLCFLKDDGDGAPFAALVTLITLVLTWIFTDFHIALLWQHWVATLAYVGGYISVGISWAIWKWYVLCLDKLKVFNTKKADYEESWAAKNDSEKKGWESYSKWVSYNYKFPPSPASFAESIYMWLMYWPLSMIGTLIGDYIVRFFRWIYTRLSTTLTRISNHVFKDTGLTG